MKNYFCNPPLLPLMGSRGSPICFYPPKHRKLIGIGTLGLATEVSRKSRLKLVQSFPGNPQKKTPQRNFGRIFLVSPKGIFQEPLEELPGCVLAKTTLKTPAEVLDRTPIEISGTSPEETPKNPGKTSGNKS